MSEDPGVVCFEHCGPRVFCLQIPDYCPACRAHIHSNTPIIPFRIPFPFVKASQYPYSIVIKPTNGDFLNDYRLNVDLHIGVTTSRCEVMEFDREGLGRGRLWSQSLVIYQEQKEEWTSLWDSLLQQVSAMDTWTQARYNEETFNCYTFVLAFLRCLRNHPMSEIAKSKTLFCEKYVSPKAAIAWKYINLYRRLNDSGYFVNRNVNK